MMDSVLPQGYKEWPSSVPIGLYVVPLILVATPLFTFLITSLLGAIAARGTGTSRKPPVRPHSIPVIGSLIGFISNAERFIGSTIDCYGENVPVQLQMLDRRVTVVSGVKNVMALFRKSRELDDEEALLKFLTIAFAAPAADIAWIKTDNTGQNAQPRPGSNNIPEEQRYFRQFHRTLHAGLSGQSLIDFSKQQVRSLTAELAAADISSNTWTDLPDVYLSFIRETCYRAAMKALCGAYIFEAIPTLVEDYWEYDKHLPSLFAEKPRWMVPAAYRARDKMRDNVKAWHEYASSHYDLSKASEDERGWEPVFGARVMRERYASFSRMPFSKDMLASNNLGLFFGAISSVMTATHWMLLEIFHRPELVARIREEVAPFVAGDLANPDDVHVDIEGVCSQPLVQSVYAEVLRLHNGSMSAKIPKTSNFTLNGWHFDKGNMILVSGYHPARATEIWNQGTDAEPHSVDEFWAERFIIDPAKSLTGPVLANQPGNEKTDGAHPTFSMKGTEGWFLPYGGGASMCPGRHFAKKEMITTTALFLTFFDMDIQGRDSLPEHDMSSFMFGFLPPKDSVRARVRRRTR